MVDALARRARSGDPIALEKLCSVIEPRVRQWAQAALPDRDAADDVTQIVLIQVWLRLGTFRGQSRFTSWVYVITRHAIGQHRRREERHQKNRVSDCPNELPVESFADALLERIASRQLAHSMEAAARELPLAQRTALTLVGFEGRTPREAADLLGITPGLIRVNLCRARKRLKARFSPRSDGRDQ